MLAVTIPESGDLSMGLADLGVKAMEVSAALTARQQEQASAQGIPVSCRKGCGACCRQVVPVSPAEAFMIARLVKSFPAPKKSRLERRFEKSLEILREALPQGAFFHFAADYFRLGLACPFLVRESCSIHPFRPSACREQLAVSRADHCVGFPNHSIRLLPMETSIRSILAELSAELLGSVPVMIPLVGALAWAEAHREEGERKWDAAFLLGRLAAKLSDAA
jgi:Fe-S-cluster containining protein